MTFKNDLFYFTSRVKDPEILNIDSKIINK